MLSEALIQTINALNTPDFIRLHKMINEQYETRKKENKHFRQARWQALNPEAINKAVRESTQRRKINDLNISEDNITQFFTESLN